MLSRFNSLLRSPAANSHESPLFRRKLPADGNGRFDEAAHHDAVPLGNDPPVDGRGACDGRIQPVGLSQAVAAEIRFAGVGAQLVAGAIVVDDEIPAAVGLVCNSDSVFPLVARTESAATGGVNAIANASG